MAEYIDKSFALYVAKHFGSMQTWSKEDIIAEIARVIENEKPADVAEVKHGIWELEEYLMFWNNPDQRLRCSACGFTHQYDEWFSYCPNCGANMGEWG